MKLTILGSCSGTEPMPGRHHCSFVIELAGKLYWFDAGECCSYTAHLMKMNMPATEAIFISHTHMDHIGGLPNLLWTLRKLCSVDPAHAKRLAGRTIEVHLPDLSVWDGLLALLAGTEGGFKTTFLLKASDYTDGVIYEQNGIQVTAIHNLHLGQPEATAPWRSFSFRIDADGKSVVYSGDVRNIEDFGSLIDGCDLILMETGHHKVEHVCGYLLDSGKTFGQLGFIHHGRAILGNPEGELKKAQSLIGDRVFVAHDGMQLEIGT